MVPNRRLLILSCSQRKHPGLDLLPAIERYDGPAFWVLRRFLRENPEDIGQLDIFILSAMYGLIPAEHPIAEYDQMMTCQRAAELHGEVLTVFTNLICTGHNDLCLAMSKTYLCALEGWSALVSPTISVTITDGPQGVKLAQLKQWLWRGKTDDLRRERQAVRPSDVARLRGVELGLTPAQVLEQARIALTDDRTGANRFRKWYVEVDSQRVAPKWLVSKLAGLPVNAFTTGEARRVLCQLGLQLRQVTETVNDH